MLVGALTGFVTQRYPQFPEPNRAGHVWLFMLLAATVSSAVVRAQTQSAARADALEPLGRLVGRWTGTSEVQPGNGQVERQYQRVLGSKCIQVHPPTNQEVASSSLAGARHIATSTVSRCVPSGIRTDHPEHSSVPTTLQKVRCDTSSGIPTSSDGSQGPPAAAHLKPFSQFFVGDVQVALRLLHARVPEHQLDDPDVHPVCE